MGRLMSLTSICLFLLVFHTGISGILLSHRAESLAHWHIPLYWTIPGQFAVSVVASAISCGLAAAVSIMAGLGEAAFFALALLLFLPGWAIGQAALISRLANKVRQKFLSSWALRRVKISTAVSILVAYTAVGIAAIGALQYLGQTNQKAHLQEPQAIEYPASHASSSLSREIPAPSEPGTRDTTKGLQVE